MEFCKPNPLPWAASMSAALLMLATLSGSAGARPARPAPDPATTDPIAAARLLDATAEVTTRRLPTCEIAINTRVSEWKASAAIACKKSSARAEACVAAQLTARAEQLKQIRSCQALDRLRG